MQLPELESISLKRKCNNDSASMSLPFFSMWSSFREVVMGRAFGAGQIGLLVFVAGNCLNAAYNVKKRASSTPSSQAGSAAAAAQKEVFWFTSMLSVILNGYGGGFLAPMLMGKPIIPAVFDPIVPLCIVSWYITHIIPKGQELLDWLPVKVMWTILLALFRTFTACNIIEKAMEPGLLKPSEFYPSIPLIGPIMVGATLGCAGMFLPFDKGLKAIENGIPWQIQGALMGSTFFHLCVHDETGVLGISLRAVVLSVVLFIVRIVSFLFPTSFVEITEDRLFFKENVRCMICIMHLVQLLGIAILNNPDFNVFSVFHQAFYFISRIPQPSKPVKSKSIDSSSGGDGSISNSSAIANTSSASGSLANNSTNIVHVTDSKEKIKIINKTGSTINSRIINNTNQSGSKQKKN